MERDLSGLRLEDLVGLAVAGWCPAVQRQLEEIGGRTGRLARIRSMAQSAGIDWDGVPVVRKYSPPVNTATEETTGANAAAIVPVIDPWQGLVLADDVRWPLDEVLTEWRKADELARVNLTPRNRILLHGPPGNGKSTVARRIAGALSLEVVAPGPGELFDSRFGESSHRAGTMLRECSKKPTALILDEIDVITPIRGRDASCSEPDRIVNSMLVEMDRFASGSMLMATTNRPELLDPAIMRRFDVVIQMPAPEASQYSEWFERIEAEFGAVKPQVAKEIRKVASSSSFARLCKAWDECLRKRVISPETFDVTVALCSAFRGCIKPL